MRWISSMNRTSRCSSFVRSPARSPGRSRIGPDVILMFAPSSFAMMNASVVLPSPGGPGERTWAGVEEQVVERLSAPARRLDEQAKPFLQALLPDELLEPFGAQGLLERS